MAAIKTGFSAGGEFIAPKTYIPARVTNVDIGWATGCAVVDGAVKCWGSNEKFLRGDGDQKNVFFEPRTVISSDAKKVQIGASYACAIVKDQLWCWGQPDFVVNSGSYQFQPTPLPMKVIPSGVTDISIGRNTACFVVHEKVNCFGGGSAGSVQTKESSVIADPGTPVTIITEHAKRVFVDKEEDLNACAIVKSGLKCWGQNTSMNRGSENALLTFFKSDVKTASVAGGSGCAVVKDDLHCWGLGSNPQGSPALVASTAVTDVGVTPLNLCYTQKKIRKCLGENSSGQTGQGEKSGAVLAAIPITMPEPVVEGQTLCHKGNKRKNFICNPLDGGVLTEPTAPLFPKHRLGLIATLYEGKNWYNLDDYPRGFKQPSSVYFSNFNTPTQAFDDGFKTSDGFLTNQNGEKLIEWFAIFSKGNITLPENKESGFYHIITLSDDGVRVTVNGKVILNNPSAHAPILDCATEVIKLSKGGEQPFALDYFQGPRYHIALMTFIKKVNGPTDVKQPFCGRSSDVNAVLRAGYEVIDPSFFTLPAGY